MNLITYDKTTKKPVTRNSKPFITMNVNGKFNFSQGARRLLSFTDGDRIVLHQDAVYRSDWYLEITKEDRGYKIVVGKTDSRFTCHRIAVEIYKSIGRKAEKLTFGIKEIPFHLNDKLLYTIETKKPF